jgi:hypothetical protein
MKDGQTIREGWFRAKRTGGIFWATEKRVSPTRIVIDDGVEWDNPNQYEFVENQEAPRNFSGIGR